MIWLKVSLSSFKRCKAVKILIYHVFKTMCFAAIVGDIAPGDGVSKEEKCRRETEAMEEIRRLLGADTSAGGAWSCTKRIIL